MSRIREPWLAVLVAATAVIDAAASIIRHVHLQSGLDLAIFDQAVWHYSRFEAPFSSIKGENLLGDHFHPVVALLAPLYWIWSDPRMLLLAQSALVAASIVPVFLFSRARLGRAGAYLLAGAYAAFWGLQVGVLYDFHEVAFAPLLIALAIRLADQHRWALFWPVILLLLGVKEDLSIFVVFFGLYLLTLREVRHGLTLVLVGIAWYELATRVAIPHLAGGPRYAYWTYGELGKNPADAIWALLRAPWRIYTVGFSPSQKVHTVAALLAPFLFLSLGSRLFILGLPLLAERFLSTNPNFWSGHYHYSLAIAPVLAMAAASGLGNVSALLSERRRRPLVFAGSLAMLLASVAVTRLGSPDSALSQITRPSFYGAPVYAAGAYPSLRHVPAGASLAAGDYVLPHVSERPDLRLIVPANVGQTAYLITNVTRQVCCDTGNATYAALGRAINADLAQMTPIYYDTGWLLAARPPSGRLPENGVLIPMPRPVAAEVKRIDGDFNTKYARLIPCYERWAMHDPGAPECLFTVLHALQVARRTLSRTVHAVLPTLRGGCTGLAVGALAATYKQVRDATPLVAAAASPNRSALPLAAAAAAADANNLDLSGQRERFAILCSPRGQGQATPSGLPRVR